MEIFSDLLKFTLIDLIDVFLVALLLYYVYKLVKGTVAINIFIGIVIIYIIWKITEAIHMQLLSNILGGFISVGMFALIVVFQQELRKFLLMIGSTNFNKNGQLFKQLKFLKTETNDLSNSIVETVIAACTKMAATHTGALIVFERNNNLDFLAHTGDEMNITVTQPIIESIFFKNSPLHDGAIIISKNIIKATRVILPVNNDKNLPQRFGLRHRAAVGVCEKTDALALVVSEETGQISYFKNGEFVSYDDLNDLTAMIKDDLI